jgi:exosome complex RNA-binding protein Csl4
MKPRWQSIHREEVATAAKHPLEQEPQRHNIRQRQRGKVSISTTRQSIRKHNTAGSDNGGKASAQTESGKVSASYGGPLRTQQQSICMRGDRTDIGDKVSAQVATTTKHPPKISLAAKHLKA